MSELTPRRRFFGYAIDEFIAVLEGSVGRPSFKLSALDQLTDQEIGPLVPAIIDASNVIGHHDHFVLKLLDGHEDVLFAKGSYEEEVWSRFDGRATIQQIAEDMTLEWDVSGEIAFARVRNLFLYLVRKQLCLPLNPLT